MSYIREPAVAGLFYPDNPFELQHSVETFLNEIELEKNAGQQQPKALIVPHAGYIYSGSTAAKAYSLLSLFADQIKRVVMLGPAHRVCCDGLATSSAEFFRTPLGDIPVDQNYQQALAEKSYIDVMDNAHLQEHSLEVQLPFLQTILGEFTLIPLVVGGATPEQVQATLENLWGDNDTLIVISSDLSHFLNYNSAQRIDQITCAAIEHFDSTVITPEHACGGGAVNGLLRVANDHCMLVKTLGLCNSGDTAGNHSRVVGYGSWAFFEKPIQREH